MPGARVGFFHWTRNGWQPRVGLSYRWTDHTVLRSGFGIYGNEPPGGMIYGALGGNRNARANAGGLTYTASCEGVGGRARLGSTFPRVVACTASIR